MRVPHAEVRTRVRVPLRFHDDPDATRASVRGLLDLPFGLLLLDHGPPQRDPKPQIEMVLDDDGR